MLTKIHAVNGIDTLMQTWNPDHFVTWLTPVLTSGAPFTSMDQL